MRRSARTAAVLLLMLAASLSAVSAASAGEYVVLLRDGATADVDQQIASVEKAAGVQAHFRYKSALHGLALPLSDAQATRVRTLTSVQAVVPDTIHTAAGVEA